MLKTTEFVRIGLFQGEIWDFKEGENKKTPYILFWYMSRRPYSKCIKDSSIDKMIFKVEGEKCAQFKILNYFNTIQGGT